MVLEYQQNDEMACILHYENPKKEHEKFKQAVYKIQTSVDQGKPVFLDRASFPPNWNMCLWGENHQMESARPIYCRHLIFQGKVVFRNLWFKGETVFDNACFQNEVIFDGWPIAGEISFKHATFQKSLTIRDVGLEKKIWFDSAIFKDNVIFDENDPISFSEGISFDKAEFQKDVSFDRTIFEGEVSFRRATFTKSCSF